MHNGVKFMSIVKLLIKKHFLNVFLVIREAEFVLQKANYFYRRVNLC